MSRKTLDAIYMKMAPPALDDHGAEAACGAEFFRIGAGAKVDRG